MTVANLKDLRTEEETEARHKEEARSLFVNVVKLNPTSKIRDAYIKKTLNDESIDFQVRLRLGRLLWREDTGLFWELENETNERTLFLISSIVALRKKHIPYILANPNWTGACLLNFFKKRSDKKTGKLLQEAAAELLNRLPDEIIVEAGEEIYRKATSVDYKNVPVLVVPKTVVFVRLKKAYGMESMPDSWLESLF